MSHRAIQSVHTGPFPAEAGPTQEGVGFHTTKSREFTLPSSRLKPVLQNIESRLLKPILPNQSVVPRSA